MCELGKGASAPKSSLYHHRGLTSIHGCHNGCLKSLTLEFEPTE